MSDVHAPIYRIKTEHWLYGVKFSDPLPLAVISQRLLHALNTGGINLAPVNPDYAAYASYHPEKIWVVSPWNEIQFLPVTDSHFGKTRRKWVLEGRVACDECYLMPKTVAPYPVAEGYTGGLLDDHKVNLCPQCLEQRFTLCGHCKVNYDLKEHVNIIKSENGNVNYCQTCLGKQARVGKVIHCPACSLFFEAKFGRRLSRNSRALLCRPCADSGNFMECELCGSVCAIENTVRQGDGCVVCYDCEGHEEDTALIKAYDYKPRSQFFGRPPFYGVELEVSVRPEDEDYDEDYDDPDSVTYNGEVAVAAKFYHRLFKNHAYLKQDGSIEGQGFEIVTHPHSLEEHYRLWDKFFDSGAVHLHTRLTQGNGMHVHIGKKYLSPMQIQKMVVFVNNAENAEFITDIAQRTSYQWARLDSGKKITTTGHDKYEALNTTPRQTIELRIFRATLFSDHFFKNLEFADSLARYCNLVSYRDLDYRRFCDFVRSQSKIYKHLDNYLSGAQYLPVKPKAPKDKYTKVKTGKKARAKRKLLLNV